jgi:hypothetical protein
VSAVCNISRLSVFVFCVATLFVVFFLVLFDLDDIAKKNTIKDKATVLLVRVLDKNEIIRFFGGGSVRGFYGGYH